MTDDDRGSIGSARWLLRLRQSGGRQPGPFGPRSVKAHIESIAS
jgi:hypothetical protein